MEPTANDEAGLLVRNADASLGPSLRGNITDFNSASTTFPPSPHSIRHGDAGADTTEFPRNLYLAEDLGAGSSMDLPLTDESSAVRGTQHSHVLTPLSNPPMSLFGSDLQPSAINGTCLPAYVIDCATGLAAEDFNFLRAKGVWDLPCESVLVSSITGFIDYVYPLTPLLDLQKELECIASNGESGKISLLLLYAVVLAGIPFMNHSLLSEAGFSSASALSKVIYRRLRVSQNRYLLSDRD
jgi:hypothetical protein